MLSTDTEAELEQFVMYPNSIHSLYKISVTKDEKEICFLDVKIKKGDERFETTLYTKYTDRNNLPWRYSFHAPEIFKSIPKGHFTRAKQICLDSREYQQNMISLVEKLTSRVYDKDELMRVENEVGAISHDKLRCSQKKSKNKNAKLLYISNYVCTQN